MRIHERVNEARKRGNGVKRRVRGMSLSGNIRRGKVG
jgi:hypothetical protein